MATRALSGLTPFSDRLAPVVVKELRQGLRADRFVVPFIAAQLMAVAGVAFELFLARVDSGMDDLGRGVLVMSLASFFVGVVMPLTALGALQPELGQGRNVELLVTANLNRWQIGFGKWLVTVILSFLLLVSQLPYLLALFQLGGLELNVVFIWAAHAVGINAVLVALAVGASGYGNMIMRLFIFGVGAGSFAASFAITVFSGGARNIPLAVLGFVAVITMFVMVGIQLARARLMVGYHPLDPPPSGLVVALMLFSPVILGMLAAVTAGYGSWLGPALMTYVIYVIDPGPGKGGQRAYHRP